MDVTNVLIRCFPHVVNLVGGAILSEIKTLIAEKGGYDFDYIIDLPDWPAYLSALESDLIGRVRKLVASCRVSAQQRQELERIIQEGNLKGSWAGKIVLPRPGGDGLTLRILQLLRDCET